MSSPTDRRGFLRSLATLPLIGGGVTLIGNPTAAAEPVSTGLLDAYDWWLDTERRFLRYERFGPGGDEEHRFKGWQLVAFNPETGAMVDSLSLSTHRAASWRPYEPPPSTRAAAVMATADVDWRA